MTIEFDCPGCGRHLTVADKFQGRRATCPTCKASLTVPNDPIIFPDVTEESAPPDVPVARPDWMATGRKQTGTEITDPHQIHSSQSNHPSGNALRPLEDGTVAYAPYIDVPLIRDPKLAEIPDLVEFQKLRRGETQLKSYRIRVRRPKFPWIFLLVCILIWPLLVTLPFVIAYHFLRGRGHTFLFLTNQRLVIVELTKSIFGRQQTVLNYSLGSVSGFVLLAQRGVKRLLNFIVYKEKRTFFISIITNTLAGFTLGSENSLHSLYDPGLDAVTLCSELDSMVLAIKAGRLQGVGQ